jgi:flagellar biosynthesis anti-sigma factor FlgM
MRIDSHSGAQPLPENQATGGAAPTRSQTTASAAGSSALGEDQAQLSGVHVQVQALVAQVLQLPESNVEKVQALRQAVASGQYKPSANQVAGALLTNLTTAKIAA